MVVLNHTQVADDPHINMRGIRVVFADTDYNYETSINGTRVEIGNYFRGARLDLGTWPNEDMQTPTRIEFLPPVKEGNPDGVDLPIIGMDL